MCGSVGFTGGNGQLVIDALTNSFASMSQQRASASQHAAQLEVAKRQMDDQYARLVADANYNMQEADLAQQQANTSATQSKFEIAREMLRAREEAKASASASGITGNTLNRMLTDISFNEQQKKAVVDTNRDDIINTRQLQKHKAIQSTKMSPMYYTEPGGGMFNSMLGIVPALFSGFNFNWASCGTTTTSTRTNCR